MNFKFTKIKTLVSIVISAIVGIYYFMQSMIFDGSPSLAEILTTKFVGFMFGFIIAFVPIYLVWSLFEKKKDESSSLNIVGIIIGVLILLAIILAFVMKFF